ncbi:MAG: hypothetical protein HYZ73_03780 [Elusimicrobia bacterium]|nr:hypothetical protein [Elusimicrobiota bacterium]
MKQTIATLLVPWGLVLGSLTGCGAPQVVIKEDPIHARPIRVAVLPFEDGPRSPGSGTLVADLFTNRLLTLPRYQVVERSQLEKVLSEQQLGRSGAIDLKTAAELGRLLGVDAIVVGRVVEYRPRFLMLVPPASMALNVRLVEVKTGSVAWSATHQRGFPILRWLVMMVPPIAVLSTLTSPTVEARSDQVVTEIVKALDHRLKRIRSQAVGSSPRSW